MPKWQLVISGFSFGCAVLACATLLGIWAAMRATRKVGGHGPDLAGVERKLDQHSGPAAPKGA